MYACILLLLFTIAHASLIIEDSPSHTIHNHNRRDRKLEHNSSNNTTKKPKKGVCCTVVKGKGNGGCLLHYAHVLYDFIIPFDWELHHSDSLQQCDQMYIPQFPLVVQWMKSLYPTLPLIPYSARGSCHGKHLKMPKIPIFLNSVDFIRPPQPPSILTEFRDHVISSFPNLTCSSEAFLKTSPMQLLIIDRRLTSNYKGNFTAKCRHYNKNWKKWFGLNMPINCGCDSGDLRGSLTAPMALAESFHRALLSGGSWTQNLIDSESSLHRDRDRDTVTARRDGSSRVVLRRLEGLSVEQTVHTFCQSSIILGHHGAGLLNTVFAPPGTLLLEVPREVRSNHMAMMPTHCNATGKILIRLDSNEDFNNDKDVDFKHPSLNVTSILANRLSRFDWFKIYFKV
mmetsp:Transcript_24566/g.24806  ORF Transcript_24566/g.24806 Transcript_24566/m.24806 type:complete len:398 (-) Transcript_24566:45-1238(-)